MKPYVYRDLIAALRRYDARFFIDKSLAKGSHRMLCHPDVDGRAVRFALPYHGTKTFIAGKMVSKIVELFQLPDDLL